MSSIEILTKIAKITANIKALNNVESSLLELKKMEFPFHLVNVCHLKTVVRGIPKEKKFDKLKKELLKKFEEMEKEDKENKKEVAKKSAKKRPAATDSKTDGTKRAPPPPIVGSAFKAFKIPKKTSMDSDAPKPEEKALIHGPVPLMDLKVEKPAWL